MSDLPALLEIVTPLGLPTMRFAAAWSGAGALVSLPATLVIADRSGAPTPTFFRLFKAAFPANDLSARDRITAGATPTRRFLAVWSAATA